MSNQFRYLTPAALLLLTLLGSSCSGTTPEPDLQFEMVEVPGVTTDHASSGGAAWVDFDGDGDLDLFVTNGYDVSAPEPSPQPNRLYRNDGRGGLEVVKVISLVDVVTFSSGSSWADYDNDGDLDVFIANQQEQDNLLFNNEGAGSFSRIEGEPPTMDGGHSYAAGWTDVDNDGRLDLFVANGGLSHAGPNRLYRNDGGGHFTAMTEGAISAGEAPSCGFAWGDYDNDGDADLFVANQGFNPATNNNSLYRNDGDWAFTKMESDASNDHLPSSAATWVDIDNDNDLDLHVTNLYGLADLLYLNDGQGGLEPLPDSPITLDGGYGFEANWEDYDNDGDVDVAVANWGSSVNFYLNDGSGGFERSDAGDLTSHIHHTGTMASGDYDADGDIDILIANWPNSPGPNELNNLYRNAGNDNHWLQLRLEGRASNRSAIGARVIVTTERNGETITQMREIGSSSGFRGASAMIAHFGLGDAAEVFSLEIHWPSGQRSTESDLAVDRLHEVIEPSPESP